MISGGVVADDVLPDDVVAGDVVADDVVAGDVAVDDVVAEEVVEPEPLCMSCCKELQSDCAADRLPACKS